MSTYWNIQELHGSLTIKNTKNLGDSVNLQNLKVIQAENKPAIVLMNNVGLKLAIGARLGDVSTRHPIMYYFKENSPAAMTEV